MERKRTAARQTADYASAYTSSPVPDISPTADWAARTWLFDLDNTLHDAGAHIFPHIGRLMRNYIQHHLNLDEARATALRLYYLKRYGATLRGLMRHHAIDPRHFLWHTHQFQDLANMVVVERGLKAMLNRLPGRKIVFSNAPAHYTQAVLTIAGIRRCFDAIYPVERFRFQSKPAVRGFLYLLRAEKLSPQACVMVEDSLANLRTAKRLGMTTVWVGAGTRQSPCADIRVASVLDLPRRLRQI